VLISNFRPGMKVFSKVLGDGMVAEMRKASGNAYTSERVAGLYPANGCTDDWMTTRAGMVGMTIERAGTDSSCPRRIYSHGRRDVAWHSLLAALFPHQ
jgi:hypothetical protein